MVTNNGKVKHTGDVDGINKQTNNKTMKEMGESFMIKRQVRVKGQRIEFGEQIPYAWHFASFVQSIYGICTDGTFRHLKLRETEHLRLSEEGKKSSRLSVFVGS